MVSSGWGMVSRESIPTIFRTISSAAYSSPEVKTFKNHAPTILNYFLRSSTNASAEAFNSKVKIFRSQMIGVSDRDFFIFRLVNLSA